MTGGKCLRGHDTSYPEARDRWHRCKKCKVVTRNRHYDLIYETSYARQRSRYSQYKKGLRNRIKLKKERLLEYAKEIFSGDGTTESI